MQAQERNLQGYIYAGHLIKESIDISWITAYKFANTTEKYGVYPEISHIDDFQAFQPVEVSNIIRYEAKVVYSHGDYIIIKIICEKV